MNKKILVALIICNGMAVLSRWASESGWLENNNFWLLCGILVMHVIISSLVLWFIRSNIFFKIAVIVFLISGQWWAIKEALNYSTF